MEVTASTYQTEVLDSPEPVLVDYYAEWCGPCHQLSPTLEKLASDKGIKLVKVNIDNEQELAEAARISSIPTVRLMVNGEVESQVVGNMPYVSLERGLGLES